MKLKLTHDGSKPGESQEQCCLCRAPTRYWYTPMDVALCGTCGSTAKRAEVPTKKQWLASEDAQNPHPYRY